MYSPAIYFVSKIQTVDDELDMDNSLDRSFQTTLSRIDKWLDESVGWIIESVDSDYINISIYNPLARS